MLSRIVRRGFAVEQDQPKFTSLCSVSPHCCPGGSPTRKPFACLVFGFSFRRSVSQSADRCLKQHPVSRDFTVARRPADFSSEIQATAIQVISVCHPEIRGASSSTFRGKNYPRKNSAKLHHASGMCCCPYKDIQTLAGRCLLGNRLTLLFKINGFDAQFP